MGDGMTWSSRGTVWPILGPNPCALRAPGPACWLSLFVSHDTKAHALLPPLLAGEGWGGVALDFLVAHPDTQNACFDGVSLSVGVGDCESHPWDSPFRAARFRASLRLSTMFQTKLSTTKAGCRSRTSAQPMARRARHRMCRVTGGLLFRQMRTTPASMEFHSAWRVGDCESHPWDSPFRAARSRASLRLSNFVPDKIVEPERVRPPPLSARYAKRPLRGALRIWRRERDSNPRSGF